MRSQTAFIGLGSNLAGPEQQIKTALKTLQTYPEMTLVRASSLYMTPPVGPVDQPHFINAVCQITTTYSAMDLLDNLLSIEQTHQRVRQERWGPRTLDLDILLYGEEQHTSPALTVPHKELLNRPFWLVPFAEIAPEWMLPNGEQVKEYVKKWNTSDITRQ